MPGRWQEYLNTNADIVELTTRMSRSYISSPPLSLRGVQRDRFFYSEVGHTFFVTVRKMVCVLNEPGYLIFWSHAYLSSLYILNKDFCVCLVTGTRQQTGNYFQANFKNQKHASSKLYKKMNVCLVTNNVNSISLF
jgi:hypothetical protein